MTSVDDMYRVIWDWMYYAKVNKTEFIRKGYLYKIERKKL